MATKKSNSAQIVLDKIAEGLEPVEPIKVDLGEAGVVEFGDYLSWTGAEAERGREIASLISDGLRTPGYKVAEAWLSPEDYKKWKSAGMSMNTENVIIVRVIDQYQQAMGFQGFLEGE